MTLGKLDIPPDVSPTRARLLSRRVMGGAQYRLEIGARIAVGETINTSDLANDLGIPKQSVNQELRLLERAGLIERMPDSHHGERRVYFTQVDKSSAYWSWCVEALVQADDMLRRGNDA